MKSKSRLFVLLISCALVCACKTGLVDRMTGEDIANEIREIGRPATGRVLKIWYTGLTVNGNPVLGFRLSIYGRDIEPFEAETKALIHGTDTSRIHVGTELAVRYDPNDHRRVALDIYDDR